ncbi:hypothetical protein JXB41_03440, partial [Candidatus Woesearchaeota archaeon]|nr:hypothetical protein [Candidatus Woesearchaeota archaeon]
MINQLIEFIQMQKNMRLPRSKLNKLRDKKLRALIKEVYLNVPFYTKTFKKLGLTQDEIRTVSDLKKLPLVTKEQIRKNFSDFLNIKYNIKK